MHINPNQTGGGANMPHRFSNAYSSGTESRIDLKPGCKFEFVCCLETYVKKSVSLDHGGTLEGLFYQGSPEICLKKKLGV